MYARIIRLIRKPGSFATIGLGVFIVGLGIQAALIRAGIGDVQAYVIQLAITVAVNVELNRRITWRGRAGSFRAVMMSASGRIVMAILAMPIFVFLNVALHMDALFATVVTVAFGTAANFLFSDKIAFRRLANVSLTIPHPLTERVTE